MMTDTQARPVDAATYVEVQRFLFHEAGLLDRREYGAWLALLTADIRYRVTARVVRDAGAAPVAYAIIDETAVGLKSRIDQISDPRLTRAENPPSLTRRFVSNVAAYHGEGRDELAVTSYILAYRTRPSYPEGGLYVAERHDVLRKTGAALRLASRIVDLDQFMLFEGALSTLL
jgi:3-phenylpropionate/cinnamic acid dioxygenase small subunit